MPGRQFVNGALRRLGVELRRKPSSLVRSPHELHVSLDLLAAHWEARHAGVKGVAVQVGAFDGSANDPLSAALARGRWRAVLVEPQPDAFAKLAQKYQDSEDVQPINAAVAETDGERALFYVEASAELPSWAPQAASFDREHLVQQGRIAGITDMERRVRQLNVPTVSPDALLASAQLDRFDLLQIDVEGYDLEILRLFDIPQRLPAIVGYEHQHLNGRDRAAAVDLLISCDYQVAMVGFDTVAYRGC